jgi:hypothetical protein
MDPMGVTFEPRRVHPFTGQPFHSEMAVLSWNFLMMLVGFSRGETIEIGGIDSVGTKLVKKHPQTNIEILVPEPDEFDPDHPFRVDGCSFAKPTLCKAVSGFLSALAVTRNTVNAGGNGEFGRRDFVWHQGTPIIAVFDKRNVLGFSMDFAEDITKTNWSMETTWIHNLLVADNDAIDGVAEVDQFNLTVSVDRPTFVNFLNQGRTIFINSQWFFRYIDGFEESQPSNGPFNVLFTLTATTGFYQDRLTPTITSVYDFMSESGAVLPSIQYRFSGTFSLEFGMALFYGKWQSTRMPLHPVSSSDHAGSGAYRQFSERGLALVRDRDEAFLRIRKTF